MEKTQTVRVLERLEQDETFRNEFYALKDGEGLDWLKSKGYDITQEEFCATMFATLIVQSEGPVELDVEDLDDVSGGGFFADQIYKKTIGLAVDKATEKVFGKSLGEATRGLGRKAYRGMKEMADGLAKEGIVPTTPGFSPYINPRA